MKTNLPLIGRFALLVAALILPHHFAHGQGSPEILTGPVINPANNHAYFLLTQGTWTASEAKATALGGHLVTINDQVEQDWVFATFATFGGTNRTLWIGLNDAASEANFVWSSGEPLAYTHWSPGEPNALANEDYGMMFPPSDSRAGFWNDSTNDGVAVMPSWAWHGVVEVGWPDPNNGPAVVTPPPTQPTYENLPTKGDGKDSLVVVTHGWQPRPPTCIPGTAGGPPNLTSLDAIADDIRNQVAPNWTVFPLYWANEKGAWTHCPDEAFVNGLLTGTKFGRALAAQGWNHIHLIAHSAGSALIQTAAEEINSHSPTTMIHTTFLDPFLDTTLVVSTRYPGHSLLGAVSDWSDNYISSFVAGNLSQAYNVDVKSLRPFLCVLGCAHGFAIDFYHGTITNGANALYEGRGFPLSKEGGNWDFAIQNYDKGDYYPLGSQTPFTPSAYPTRNDGGLNITTVPYAWSSSGTVQLYDYGASLTTESPVWLALGITVSNAINFVTFDAQFTSPPNAQGLLSVTWNTNRIGYVDETAVSAGLQTYTFPLPKTYTSGDYVLGFRLDPYTNITSSVSVTNISFGYIGLLTNLISLNILAVTNQTVSLALTAPTGYIYAIEASTNLNVWSPLTDFFNTNTVMNFSDQTATNLSQRFYRGVVP